MLGKGGVGQVRILDGDKSPRNALRITKGRASHSHQIPSFTALELITISCVA